MHHLVAESPDQQGRREHVRQRITGFETVRQKTQHGHEVADKVFFEHAAEQEESLPELWRKLGGVVEQLEHVEVDVGGESGDLRQASSREVGGRELELQ